MAKVAFRSRFDLPYKLDKWFPGHMYKGMRDMQRKLKSVDCIIELHDARIPFSGRNNDFRYALTAIKPHILVLNKMDLCDLTYKNTIMKKLKSTGVDKVIFAQSHGNAVAKTGYHEIMPSVVDLIRHSPDRFNRSDSSCFNVMIIGIPNVGKSTLINKLRSIYIGDKKAAQVGANAGVTRSVGEKIKICENPPVYLLDTPGVLEPKAKNDLETIMRCALCATTSDDIIGIRNIADYLLYWMNKHNHFGYVDFFGLDNPSDSIVEVLVKGAINFGNIFYTKDVENSGSYLTRPNLDNTAQQFVKAFRCGEFGRVLLDDDLV